MMGLGNTYSWVFTQIRVDPKDVNTVYVQALNTNVSHDGGATFTRYGGSGGDNHRMWIDPDHPQTTYIAHDGGFTMTDDGGATRKQARGINGTQFYNVEVDNMTPFHIYGSVQDTGTHRVALDLSKGFASVAPLNWEGGPGGEGSNQAIDLTNPNIVYSHGYYANFSRADYAPPPAPGGAGTNRRGGRGRGGRGWGRGGPPRRPGGRPGASALPPRTFDRPIPICARSGWRRSSCRTSITRPSMRAISSSTARMTWARPGRRSAAI